MAQRYGTCDAGRGLRKPLLTFERADPDADVLVVTSGWPNEDNETYCVFIERQMETMFQRGVRCDVLFIRGYRSPLAYLLAGLRLAAWSIKRKRRYRLVHAHSGEAALAARLYLRAPLLVSYLGDDLLGTPRADAVIPLRSKLRRALFRQHSRLARMTITKSAEMQAALPASVQRRNTVLPNGVDPSLFRPVDRTTARRPLGWSETKRVALFAADPDVPRKRYWLARAAVERAQTVLPDLCLHVARGIPPAEIPLLMSAADCLLLTSSIEGSPNVVKEALMCNLPVVATPVGDVRELLAEVSPSFVCEPSAEALSEALLRCVESPRRSNGRDRSRHLDAEVIADRLLALYKTAAPRLRLRETAGRAASAVETTAV
jgi:teichuronic acid biosynthesis glycosyltransferase TuaC